MKYVLNGEVQAETGVYSSMHGLRCDEVRLRAADMAALCNPQTPDAVVRGLLFDMATRFVAENGLKPV
jgi:hypothetical protein